MTQSFELTKFYRAYVAWLNAGSYENSIFSKDTGLCDCLQKYFRSKNWRPSDIMGIVVEMEDQFSDAGLDFLYPFNKGYYRLYKAEDNTKHLNPLRIKWVREHAELDTGEE